MTEDKDKRIIPPLKKPEDAPIRERKYNSQDEESPSKGADSDPYGSPQPDDQLNKSRGGEE